MKLKTISIALAAAMLAVAIAPVSAQTQAQPQTKVKRHPQPVAIAYGDERPPLTVNKRSFLDPGPVVPVGSGTELRDDQHDLQQDAGPGRAAVEIWQ